MAMTALDYEQIRQLLGRYARALDFGDAEGVAGCFAPEGFFELEGLPPESPNGGRFQGRESLLAFATNLFAATQGASRHWASSTPVIEGDGETATGWLPLLILRPGEAPHCGVLMTGIYRDEYVKVDGDWRFAARRFTSDPQPQHAALKPDDVLVVRFDEAYGPR